MPEPLNTTSLPFQEQLLATRPLKQYPAAAREIFRSILLHREATKAYYRSFPPERIDEGIGNGDSPRKELIHQIGNTRLRAQAFETGSLPNWRYYEVKPEEHAKLEAMNLDQLLEQLDRSTEDLYDKSVKATFGEKEITLPFEQRCLEIVNLASVEAHDILHLGFLVQFGNYFGTERPQAMKNLWG